MADNNDTPTGEFSGLTAPEIGKAMGYTPAPDASHTNGQHPAELEHQAEPDTTPRQRTSWWPIDLDDALNGVSEPEPTIWARTDGVSLIYPGKTHVFAGESESCKTWGAAAAAAQHLADTDGRVLWIDYEDEAQTLTGRLLALGVPKDTIRARVDYIHPHEPTYDTARHGADIVTTAGLDFHELLRPGVYSLAVIDGVTEGMVTEGLDPLGTSDAAIWARRIAKRIADQTGAAVISIDHVPKGNGDTPKRYALGSQHKTSGLTGAYYSFEIRKAFHRAIGNETHTGVVTVKVGKDRPGHVRRYAAGSDMVTEIGTLELSADPDGRIGARLLPPGSSSTAPPLSLLVKIAEHLDMYPGSSGAAVCKGVPGKEEVKRDALKYMLREGHAVSVTHGNSFLHTLTSAGHDAYLDPGR